MSLTCGKESAMQTKKIQGDGFLIENNIIKGIEKQNNFNFKTIAKDLLQSLNEGSENIAQIDAISGKQRTFKDVKDRSIHLAVWMKKEGIQPGDLVTICSPNHPDVEVVIIAIFLIGAVYNVFPRDLDLNSARLYLKHIEQRVIFVHKNKIDIFREAATLENLKCRMIVFDGDSNYESFDDILNLQSSYEVDNFQSTPDVDPKSICAITPTSGTTGTPKFACHTHENLILRLFIDYDLNLNNTYKTAMIHLNPQWTFYVRSALLHLLLKSTKIFPTDSLDYDFEESFKIIEKYNINTLILNSYNVMKYSHTDEACNYDLTSVTYIESGGQRLSQNTIKKLQEIFPNANHCRVLGSTEAGTITKYTEKCRNPQSQGTVLPNVQLKIVDLESGLILGPNKVGEICIKSPYTMIDYYNNPNKTALLRDDEGWFHVADEAYFDENGEIIYVGRLKDLIKYRGTRLQAGYVEKLLMSHPDIIEAAVVGIPHEIHIEQPVACIKKVKESKITEEDIMSLTKELYHKDTFKKWVVFMDEMPRTTNGKIDKRILRKQLEELYL